MEAVAMTDHGNVAGAYKFIKACKEAEIKPLLGMEAYYTVEDRTVRAPDALGENYYHLVLIAQNNAGLHNLFQLSSLSYSSGQYYKPRIDDDLLAQYSGDLIATTACLGSRASQLILRNQTNAAEKLIQHHAEIFKDRFFVELQGHHGEQEKVNKVLMEIAGRHNLPLILTADCHYSSSEDKQLHEAMLAVQTKATLADPKRMSFGDLDVHLADPATMIARAIQYGIPEEAITNTAYLASMVDSKSYFSDVINKYPLYRSLPEGTTAWDFLEDLSKTKLTEKFGGMPPLDYRERMNEELLAIKRMGFSDYILIVWEFIVRSNEIGVWTGPGRGSAAGSLVMFALGITQVDPIKHNLLFSRFLNEGRASTPLIFDDNLKKQIEAMNVCTGKNHCRCPSHRD